MNEKSKFLALSDEMLVKKICEEQNTLVFKYLCDRYKAKIYNKCFGFVKSRAVASQLTQDVFLEVYKKLNMFKPKTSFSSWIFAITYDVCSQYKTKNKEKNIAFLDNSNSQHLKIEVSDSSLFQMRPDKLKKALELINPKDKAILLLKYQDDASLNDLEVLLNTTQSAVKLRLKTAKARIVEMYNTI